MWQGCYNRLAAHRRITAGWERLGKYVHSTWGALLLSKYSETDQKKCHRSTRLGLISIKHSVLGSSECVSLATQPTASSRRVSEVGGFGVRTSPICVPALYIAPCLTNFSSNTNIFLLQWRKPQISKKKRGRVEWKATQNQKRSKMSPMYGEEGDQYPSDADGLPDSSRGGSWPLTDASEWDIGPSGGGDNGLRSIESSDAVFPGDGVLSRPREIFSLIARSLFTSCSK